MKNPSMMKTLRLMGVINSLLFCMSYVVGNLQILCCWGSPDPQRFHCGSVTRADVTSAFILMRIRKSAWAGNIRMGEMLGSITNVVFVVGILVSLGISGCSVVGDLRIPNAFIAGLRPARMIHPHLFSCGFGNPHGRETSAWTKNPHERTWVKATGHNSLKSKIFLIWLGIHFLCIPLQRI